MAVGFFVVLMANDVVNTFAQRDTRKVFLVMEAEKLIV